MALYDYTAKELIRLAEDICDISAERKSVLLAHRKDALIVYNAFYNAVRFDKDNKSANLGMLISTAEETTNTINTIQCDVDELASFSNKIEEVKMFVKQNGNCVAYLSDDLSQYSKMSSETKRKVMSAIQNNSRGENHGFALFSKGE